MMKKTIFIFSAGLLCAFVISYFVMPGGDRELPVSTPVAKPSASNNTEPSQKTSAFTPSEQAGNGSQPNTTVESAPPAADTRPVPHAVAGLLEKLGVASDEERAGLINEIANLWAAKDPAGAMAWAFSLEPGSDRVVASVALRDWGKADPAGVFAFLRGMEGNPRLSEYATQRLFSQWAMDDPKAAMEAAGTIANPKLFGETEANILRQWSESDPATTAAILNSKIENGSDLSRLTEAFGTAANFYALNDPAAAAAWTKSLPDGPAKSSAVSGLMNSWLSEDPQAASTWLGELEPGETRDAGISTLVLTNRSSDPQSAFQWAGSISNPEQRSRLTQMAALSWLALSPDTARTALQRSSILTQDEKNYIFSIQSENP